MSFFGRTPAFFGGEYESVLITSDTLVGNLWDFMGNPVSALNIEVIVDGVDAADILVPVDFNAGCTFKFQAINGGRFVGTGGAGGDGADDNGASGTNGDKGSAGGHAIEMVGFPCDIDVDDGYLFGGGGGGGGGGFKDEGTFGDPGGGGGGGQGFGTSAGGAAGTPSGTPIANPGSSGDTAGPGTGGQGGDGSSNAGGTGGGWGYGGEPGGAPSLSTSFFGPEHISGAGGRAGNAVKSNGQTVNFVGALSETNLRIAGRLKGEVGAVVQFNRHIERLFNFDVGLPKDNLLGGWEFRGATNSRGILALLETGTTTNRDDAWTSHNIVTGSDYEVLDTTLSGGATWTLEPTGGPNAWRQISVTRQWSRSAVGPWYRVQLFQIRRDQDTGGHIDGGWIRIISEWEP